jgi:hypothetical protein
MAASLSWLAVCQFMRKTKKHNPAQIAMKANQIATSFLCCHFDATSIT